MDTPIRTQPQEATTGMFNVGNDFKTVNPEAWVEMAMRQCIASITTDHEKFVIAVNTLEATCVHKIDKDYEEKIEKRRKELEAEYGTAEKYQITKQLTFAHFKLREIIKLVYRSKEEPIELVI